MAHRRTVIGRRGSAASRGPRTLLDRIRSTPDSSIVVVGEAREELVERDAGLEPRQRRAEAEVHAVPEAHRAVDRAVEVEQLGFLVHPLVVVGRAGDEDDARVGRDRDAVQRDVGAASTGPGSATARPTAASPRPRWAGGRRSATSSRRWSGYHAKRDHAVGDEAGHRLVAGERELEDPVRELLVGEEERRAVVVGDLGPDQQADDVVARGCLRRSTTTS